MFGEAELIFALLTLKPLIVSVSLGLLLAFGYSLRDDGPYFEKLKQNLLPSLGYTIPIGLIAFIAGYLTGISRSAAIGTTVPAVLALLGGLNIYFFGTESRYRLLVGYCVFVFGVVFFYAVLSGVDDREVGRVDRFIALSEQEFAIRNYRINRGLPADPAKWLLNGEGPDSE